MKCTGHNPLGQRMRTSREREAAYRMQASGKYSLDQWSCEEELRAIHETECEACKDLNNRIRDSVKKVASQI